MALERATALTGLDDALKESYLAKLLDVSSGDELDLGEIQTAVVSVVCYIRLHDTICIETRYRRACVTVVAVDYLLASPTLESGSAPYLDLLEVGALFKRSSV